MMLRTFTIKAIYLVLLGLLVSNHAIKAQPCFCTVSQNGTTLPFDPLVGTTDAITWIDYNSAGLSSSNTGIEQGDALVIALYEDQFGQYTLGLTLDLQNDGTGGSEVITVSCVNDGAFLAFGNEADEAAGAPPTFTGNFAWGPPNNDGMFIGGITCPMTITIDAGFADGISGAAVATGDAAAPTITGLPGTGTITINCGGGACCPTPVVNDVNILNATCPTSMDGSITINESTLSGLPPFLYNWEGGDFPPPPFNQITGLNPGFYTVTVTDSQGCEEINTYQIFASNPAPVANPAPPLTACSINPFEAIFDLTQLNNIVNGGTGDQVTWYEDPDLFFPIFIPQVYTSFAPFLPVYAVVNNGICNSEPVEIMLLVNITPFGAPASLTLCEEANGEATFDLTQADDDIAAGTGAVNYFEDEMLMTAIADPTAYTSGTATIYAQIDDGICTSDAIEVDLIVNPAPTGMPDTLEACSDVNGLGTFDLSEATPNVNTSMGMVSWYEDDQQMTVITDTTAYISSMDTVFAFITLNGCISSPVPVYLNTTPIIVGPPDSLYLCDDTFGFATFDLASLESTLLMGSDSINWFEDTLATIPIGMPSSFNTDSTTVYYILYNGDCGSPTTPVSLFPLPTPVANPDTISLCDEGSNSATFDLTSLNPTVSGGIGTVDWYEDSGVTMSIATPASYTTTSTTVFATVSTDSCTSAPVAVEVIVIPLPVANADTLEVCADINGIGTFDLTTAEPTISGGSGTVDWYLDDMASMSIADPVNFSSDMDTIVYATLSDGTCTSLPVAINLTVFPLPQPTPEAISLCDDGAGFATFDLTQLEPGLLVGNDSINWFEDMAATLPIIAPDTYNSDATTVYYILYANGCSSPVGPVTLTPLPTPTVQTDTLSSCDEGNGTGTFDLNTATIITNGVGTLNWFEDAGGTTPIVNINNYNSVPATIFVQAVEDTCSSAIIPVELTLIQDVSATTDTIELCGNGSGIATFNLTTLDAGVSSGTGMVNWFEDSGATTPIATPANFTSMSTTVFANVSSGTCTSPTVPVIVTVVPLPVANPDNQEVCADINGIGTFDLTASDATISGGVGTVNWFSDAMATVSIAAPTTFTTSNDSTVFANIFDGVCTSLPVAVNLTVFPLPEVMPDTLRSCDQGQGIATFDLNTATVTTTPGTTVSWFEDSGATIPITTPGAFQSLNATVYAVVEDANCAAAPVAVELEAILAQAPDLACSFTAIDSVAFAWDMIADSFSITYEVNMGGIVGPIIVTDTTFGVSGLMEGDVVSIEVTALIDPLCTMGISSMESCTADECQPVAFDYNLVSEYCNNEAPFMLTATPTGGTFSGDGVTGDMLDPGVLSGSSFVFYDYFDVATLCLYRDSVEIMVFDTLDPVMLNCTNITVNDITFNWNDVGADAYQLDITINGMPEPTVTTTELDTTISGLSELTMVMITVTPLGPPPCGNGPATSTTCTTDPCPPTSISNDFLEEEYCSDTSGISLPDLYPGGVYAGPGVMGLSFDPDDVGAASAIISFSYTDTLNGCSYILEDTVSLIDPLVPPTISCGPATPNSVTFDWVGSNPDGYQYYYQVENDPPTAIDTTFANTLLVESISDTQSVTLYISAIGTAPCGDSPFDSLTCISAPCPPQPLVINNWDSTYCTNLAAFVLDVVPTGGTFSGPGINGDMFEPSVAGAGPVTILYEYTDTTTDCSYSQTFDAVLFDTLEPPTIICGTSTPSSVNFSWNDVGATEYFLEWTIDNVPAGDSLLTDTMFSVINLLSEQVVGITLTALGPPPCGDATPSTAECTSAPCPVISFEFTAPFPLCSTDGDIQLEVIINGSSPTGTTTWSGDGIETDTGIFDPTNAIVGDNNITISYVDGVCSYDTMVVVNVHPEPVASFTADGTFCSDSTLIIAFDGMATDSATLNWLLDGGTIVQALPNDSLEVSWPAAGNYSPALVIEDNGCVSDTFILPVELIAPLIPPVISCNPLNYTTIEFTWPAVVGADSYQVTTTAGTGSLVGTTYTVSDLMPGESTTVTVTAIGTTPCGPVTSELTCNTDPCPEISFEFTAPSPVCSVDGTIDLSVNVIGSSPEGTTTWTGDGVITSTGTFDPTQAILGDNAITITYDEEGVCIYDTTVFVNVHPEPVASFIVEGTFCSDSTLILTFDGMATDSAMLVWGLDGGTIIADMDTVLEVSWPAAGNYDLTLEIEDNGCISDLFTLPVELIAPLVPPTISCESQDNTSILFSWDPVDGADTYQVTTTNGMGVLTGTTYLVTGLLPEESTTVTVTAIGTTPCGPVTSELECNTPPCPEVNLNIAAPSDICSGETIDVTFDITGVTGDFEVSYQVNAGATETVTIATGEQLSFPNVTADFDLEIISFFASDNIACVYMGGQSVQTQVMIPPVAGTSNLTPSLCIGTDSTIQLFDLLSGADPGGSWQLVSPASAPGFDAVAGTLNTSNLVASEFIFMYTVSGMGICPDDMAEVSVVINRLPAVEAGDPQEISCNIGMVSIGSSSNPSGTGISYLWTSSTPGVMIPNPTNAVIDVAQPGDYTLTITNEFGCTASDEVTVTASLDAPIGFITAEPPSCFGIVDAFLNIDSIIGGIPPYTITINDQVYSNQTAFFNLEPGDYTVVIEGDNGCQTEQVFSLPEPPELTVEITTTIDVENNESLIFGDSTLLNTITTNVVPIDTFIWVPEGSGSSFWASPQSTAMYSVTVIDENGCTAEDDILIIVEKIRDVFVPNVFSPNDDGRNDIFYIQSGPQLANIKSFLIFNRWGETLFERRNILPNDPNNGWDGRFRGELLNPAVFTWFAEVEFIDGEVTIIKGDVTLLR